ncbi:MAG: hypothetical protein JW841_16930, partial [Deltaproteobacteria bacterium]|nr:hypothetical protein [Deltaproteobacteria bacterium]
RRQLLYLVVFNLCNLYRLTHLLPFAAAFCCKIIANAGINRILFDELYRDEHIFTNAEKLGIELVKCENNKGGHEQA